MSRRKSTNEKAGDSAIVQPNFKPIQVYSLLDSSFLDRVLYARKGAEDPTLKTTDLGGDNITVEDAIVSCSIIILLWFES